MGARSAFVTSEQGSVTSAHAHPADPVRHLPISRAQSTEPNLVISDGAALYLGARTAVVRAFIFDSGNWIEERRLGSRAPALDWDARSEAPCSGQLLGTRRQASRCLPFGASPGAALIGTSRMAAWADAGVVSMTVLEASHLRDEPVPADALASTVVSSRLWLRRTLSARGALVGSPALAGRCRRLCHLGRSRGLRPPGALTSSGLVRSSAGSVDSEGFIPRLGCAREPRC